MYNLCILTSHFYPVKSSCSSLFKDLIKSLLNENFKITIMSISGINHKVRQINTKKLSYISVKNPYLQSNQNYLRAIGDIVAITKLTKFYKKKNFGIFDQVLVYTPSIFWSIILFKIKKKIVNIKLGDLYPKWLVDHKIINKYSLSYLFLKFFELLIYYHANNVFVQTKKDILYLKKYKKLFNFNTDVIYNWIDTKKSEKKIIIRSKKKYTRFLFLGVIGLAQDYKLLHKMIEYCNKKNFEEVWIIGGEKIYTEFFKLNIINEIYQTKIYENYICDTYFPEIDYRYNIKKFFKISDNPKSILIIWQKTTMPEDVLHIK